MSEYWKSTPKYWCKFCSTYVRDTKLEKQQHEATPRHKGQVQRALRGIHRDHEREEREKQRAKNEVARLNGLVGQKAVTTGDSAKSVRKTAAPPLATAPPKEANPLERKRQLAQLAELGVAIPKEFRGEMAMLGDWEYVPQAKKTGEGQEGEGNSLSFGVRKRKFEGQEEEEEAGDIVAKKGWGQTFKEYPDAGSTNEDIDALLAGAKVKAEPPDSEEGGVKKEELDDDRPSKLQDSPETTNLESSAVKSEDEGVPTSVVFKKRKPKTARV